MRSRSFLVWPAPNGGDYCLIVDGVEEVINIAEADIEETIAGRPTGYVVPKPNRAEDIRRVVAIIERLEERHHLPFGSTKLLPIATETPEGLLHIREIAGASPRIAAISWGIEDLSAAMGLPRTRDAEGRYLDIPRYARVMCAVAASAAGVEAIDTVYTDIADVEGLRRECRDGVAMSFTGKISIHPSQIFVINDAFTPSKALVDEARALVAEFEEHARRGAYAFRFKGQMVDAPHLTRARKIIARADG
jgi:citrate lyase subunit beta/citryl-CoA lyase